MIQRSLDENASRYFTYRHLIECSDTAQGCQIQTVPLQPQSWDALSQLATKVLDPIVERFGSITLSYGFCSPQLSRLIAKKRAPHIAPMLDQHSAHELNTKHKFICNRLGAACDFVVDDTSINMQQVGQWICSHLKFDRLYYYGKASPIHISYGPDMNQFVQLMRTKAITEQRVPSLKGRCEKALKIISEVTF